MNKYQQLRNRDLVIRQYISAASVSSIDIGDNSPYVEAILLLQEHGFGFGSIMDWLSKLDLRGSGTCWSMNMVSLYGSPFMRRWVSVRLEGFGGNGPIISITGHCYTLLCELITDELTGVHTIRLLQLSFIEGSELGGGRVQRNQAVKIASSKWFDAQKASAT